MTILTYPIRTGTHFNTGFAFCLASDWARQFDPELEAAMRMRAAEWFGGDRNCQAWEPGGDEFLSPALIEALCMMRTQPRPDFQQWFGHFLPRVSQRQPATLFTPAIVSDRSDGKIAHLDGLNLSRAWCWRSIAPMLGPTERAIATEAADEHLDAAIASPYQRLCRRTLARQFRAARASRRPRLKDVSMLDTSRRTAFNDDHEAFRDSVRRFFAKELIPHLDRWEEQGIVDRDFWNKCGEAGLLCPTVPEAYGGLGLDFGYNAVIDEELGYAGSSAGITLHSDIVADYLVAYGSEEQKALAAADDLGRNPDRDRDDRARRRVRPPGHPHHRGQGRR